MSPPHDNGCRPDSAPSPQLIFRASLPASSDAKHLLLHTVVRDDQGHLYLSDEFNHRIISLDCSGAPRWNTGEKGSGEGQFLYPRGIALGSILIGAEVRRCLAVCDAWNNRVQFLDLSGTYLCCWHAAGARAFGEVCDIRYLGSADTADGEYWLVLDRGNHRLCGLDIHGQLLFEVGRAFPPDLESQWKKRCLEPVDDTVPVGIAHDFPSFDPLFYPTRILGRSETGLYLFEPSTGQLKQPLFGSLFPLSLRLPCGDEWVAAADDVFLAWNAAAKNLRWLDASGKVICEATVAGKPVGSHLPAGEVCLHSDGQLELWRFNAVARSIERPGDQVPFQALVGASENLIGGIDSGPIENVFQNLLTASRSCLGKCEELLKTAECGGWGATEIASVLTRVISDWNQGGARRLPSSRQIHELWLAALKLRLVGQSRHHPETVRRLKSLQAQLENATGSITRVLVDAVRCRDKVVLLRLDLHQPGHELDGEAHSALLKLEDFLWDFIHELLRWSGTQFCSTDLVLLPTVTGEVGATAGFAGGWIRRPHRRTGAPLSRCLREVSRFALTPSDIEVPPNPLCIARTSDEHYFVSLYTRGTLVHFDGDGRIVEELFGAESGRGTLSAPAGLAADSRDRLWIVEHLANSVRIYDPLTGKSSAVNASPALPDGFFGPVGIVPGPDDSMLVADSGHHRIVSVWSTGYAEVFCGRMGTGPGEFRRPMGICATAPDGDSGFWVVDQRNHRLQKFDRSARFVQQVGNCGPCRGSFLVPHYVAQFPDGVLAVSQNQIDRCIKLVSPEGEELDHLFLDYLPAGLLISSGRLLVAEGSGWSVRVYERTR